MPNIDHVIEQAMTEVTNTVNADKVSARVRHFLESGEGYPESFTADEMEAIYVYAILGRWCWFKENAAAKEAQ